MDRLFSQLPIPSDTIQTKRGQEVRIVLAQFILQLWVLLYRKWSINACSLDQFCQSCQLFPYVTKYFKEFLNLLHNIVNSMKRAKFQLSLHRTEERQFWIDFNKRNPLNAGSWEWSDGTPVSLSKLEKSEMNLKQVALEPVGKPTKRTQKEQPCSPMTQT